MGTSLFTDDKNDKLIVGYLRKYQQLYNISIALEICTLIRSFKSTGYKVFVIGRNANGELGLGHEKDIKILTELKTKNRIKKIYQGYRYCIYKDEYDQYWSAGLNDSGQCCSIKFTSLDFSINTLKEINPCKYNKMNKIKRIFTSINSECTFWMDINGDIYGHGRNDTHQLGRKSRNVIVQNTKIDNLPSNIKSIQGTVYYTLALDHNGIVYSTGYDHGHRFMPPYIFGGHGHGQYKKIQKFTKFQIGNEISHHHHIIQIECGHFFSMLLSNHGSVYSMGQNNDGQCGVGDTYPVERPMCIASFRKAGIRIIKIKCGENHTLALSRHNKIYSWGMNRMGQCGHGDDIQKVEPLLIENLKTETIIKIKCGKEHSYCKTNNNKHYLWGSNQYNECITNDDRKRVKIPFCINDIIDQQIQNVFLSHYNTKLLIL